MQIGSAQPLGAQVLLQNGAFPAFTKHHGTFLYILGFHSLFCFNFFEKISAKPGCSYPTCQPFSLPQSLQQPFTFLVPPGSFLTVF